jgi:LacI family transcriptional regulator
MSPAQWPGLEAQTVKEERRLVSWVKSLPRPIGILAVDDSAACDLAAACLKAGIIVPDEIAIIGVNNDDLLCQSAWPPLSSVEGDFSRVGYTAAVILDRLLSGEKIPIDQRTVLVPPLGIVRRLRGCFRTGRSIESCGGIPPDRADTARLREVVKQPPSTDVLAVDDPQLSQAVSFIREHACDPCSIEDVLNHIAVGRRWLERQFALKLNRTPHDEILRVQMDAAKRLLLQPGLPIEDIATRCGFSSAPSLGRAFVRSFKITPAAFRRRSITIV